MAILSDRERRVSSKLTPARSQLDRLSLREQARSALRTSVITGEIVSGQLYTAGTFADRLGMSLTPIREALSDLANNGLVEVISKRGFIVPELTDGDLDEIFDLRLLLEVPAIERIAGRLSTEDLIACHSEVERGTNAAHTGDLTTFLEADRVLHLRLLSAVGNARLVTRVDRLRDEARLYGLRDLAAGALLTAAEEHRQLLAAVEAGDARAAGQRMMLHLKHTRGAWAGRVESADERVPGRR